MLQYMLYMDQSRWRGQEIWRVELWNAGNPVFAGTDYSDDRTHPPGKQFRNRQDAENFILKDSLQRERNFKIIE